MTGDLMIEAPPSNNSKYCKGNLSYTFIRLHLILWVIFSYPYFWYTPQAKYFKRFFRVPLNNFLSCPEADGVHWRVKDLSLNFDRQFPILFIFMFVQDQAEMKSGHFIYFVSYTLYLAHEAIDILYIIHQCHQVFFLARLHPIDPHCNKPH